MNTSETLRNEPLPGIPSLCSGQALRSEAPRPVILRSETSLSVILRSEATKDLLPFETTGADPSLRSG
jgi:hypothetical protein